METTEQITTEEQDRAAAMAEITAVMGALDDGNFEFFVKFGKSLAGKLLDSEPFTGGQVDEDDVEDVTEPAVEDTPKRPENELLKAFMDNASIMDKTTAMLLVKGLNHENSDVDNLMRRYWHEWQDEIVNLAIHIVNNEAGRTVESVEDAAAVTLAAGFIEGTC